MKQKISLYFTVLIVSVILLPIAASAHKGRTDDYGGHYDGSAGEYHYHHGFDAHQHYDINGDGIPDCPYDYEDRTNHSSGSSGGSGNYTAVTVETNPPEYFTIVKDKEVPVYRIPMWIYVTFGIILIVIGIMVMIIRMLSRDNEEQKKIYDSKILSLQSKNDEERKRFENASIKCQELEKQIAIEKQKRLDKYRLVLNEELKEMLRDDIGEDYLCSLSNAPPGSYVDSFGMPHCISNGNDIFLFYVSSTGKYHTIYCHHAKGCKEINALQIKNSKSKLTPCFVCSPKLPDTDWVIRYVQYSKILETMQSEEDTKKS